MHSRVNELPDGDKNSNYFHHKADSRRRRNSNKGLFDDDGRWWTTKVDLERLITAYYEKLFSTSSPSGFSEALEGIDMQISEEMNDSLNADPTTEEIRAAVFQMHPTKAPSTDGLKEDRLRDHTFGGRLHYCA